MPCIFMRVRFHLHFKVHHETWNFRFLSRYTQSVQKSQYIPFLIREIEIKKYKLYREACKGLWRYDSFDLEISFKVFFNFFFFSKIYISKEPSGIVLEYFYPMVFEHTSKKILPRFGKKKKMLNIIKTVFLQCLGKFFLRNFKLATEKIE